MRVPALSAVPSFTAPTLLRRTAAVFLGVALITASAKIRVPFYPVPMTLHTLAVALIAVAYGPRFAAATFSAYLAAGAAGWPVFSGTPERGIGLAYMMGPTGGCLVGYLVASGLIGVLAEGRGIVGRLLAMGAGMIVIYAGDVTWLAVFVPVDRLWAVGVAPFILADAVKLCLVALAAPAAARLLRPLTGR